jgi:TonB family protein
MSSISAFALTTILLLTSVAQAGTLQNQLTSDYVGKVLTLRHFYQGDHLKFQPDGTLIGDAPVGPWTVDGQILVEKARLRNSMLTIKGRRLVLLFDKKAKEFQDYLVILKDFKEKGRRDLEKCLRKMNVEIEIALPSEKPDQQQVASAMRAVFLSTGESMTNVVPDYWRACFELLDHRPLRQPDQSETIYFAKLGSGVTAPHIVSDPEPEYSETARQMKLQGTVFVTLIVDTSGAVRNLQIANPLGAGLDEEAVEAVKHWKFEPGQKDGRAVPVSLGVEVTFHLY